MKKLIILIIGIYAMCFYFSCKKKDKNACPVCPVVENLYPSSGKKGDTILITGKNFSSVLTENLVTFNGVSVAPTSMLSGSSTELRVLVPGKCGTGPVEVKLDDELYSENGPTFNYDAQTKISTVAGVSFQSANTVNGTTFSASRFKSPSQLAIDASGNIYVLDEMTGQISKLTLGTSTTYVLTDTINTQVKNPTAIAVDQNSVLYISSFTPGNSGKTTMYKLTPGSMVPTFYCHDFDIAKKHVSLVADKPGEFYIGRQTTNLSIDLYDINHYTTAKGHQEFTNDAGTAIYLKNGYVYSIRAISAHGLYETEFYKYNLTDTIQKVILDNTAGLNFSEGLVVDDAGNGYIADTKNNRIIKCSPNGVVTTLVSTGLNLPKGMVIDKAGNIYVADSGNHCIKKITFD
jgi:sugar lactone lactonase YvrE